jgi:hypothetical protein
MEQSSWGSQVGCVQVNNLMLSHPLKISFELLSNLIVASRYSPLEQ